MGDAACWLDRTCLSCGRFLESDHLDDDRCPHCGGEWVLAPSDRRVRPTMPEA